MPRETGSTKSAKSETLLVLFCCAPRFEAMAPLYGVDSAIQLCTFRLSSLFSTASERKFPVSLIYRHIHTLLGQNFIVL
jgi:hypothetical protein